MSKDFAIEWKRIDAYFRGCEIPRHSNMALAEFRVLSRINGRKEKAHGDRAVSAKMTAEAMGRNLTSNDSGLFTFMCFRDNRDPRCRFLRYSAFADGESEDC